MSETRVTKVKFDGSKVRIEYEKKRSDGQYDEYTLSSLDAPSVEFQNCLQSLAIDVVTICELDGKDVEKLKVRGVSFTHTNDIMGACITALKALETSNAPLVLNTPHLPSEAYGGDDTSSPTLEPSTVSRLNDLAGAALRFIDGERAQGDLFAEAKLHEALAALDPGDGTKVSFGIDGGPMHEIDGAKHRAKAVELRREAAAIS